MLAPATHGQSVSMAFSSSDGSSSKDEDVETLSRHSKRRRSLVQQDGAPKMKHFASNGRLLYYPHCFCEYTMRFGCIVQYSYFGNYSSFGCCLSRNFCLTFSCQMMNDLQSLSDHVYTYLTTVPSLVEGQITRTFICGHRCSKMIFKRAFCLFSIAPKPFHRARHQSVTVLLSL